MKPDIGIRGAAYYLPPTRKRIADVFADERVPATALLPNVDFQRDIGIEAVHIADGDTPTSLCVKAAQAALAQAGVTADELDLIVDFTSIPEDYPAPTWAVAGRVQHEIGASRALAIAVNTGGCTSYHVGLRTAIAMMQADARINVALLFAGDKTPPLNKTYYPITVTCDGSSAVVLQKGHDRRVILAVEIAVLGELHDVWTIPGLGRRRADEPVSEELLYMTSDLKKFMERVIPANLFMFRKVMKGALKRAGLTMADVKYYVYPTFSTWDQSSFCRGFGLPPERVSTEGLARHGHLQENDMVMNYVDAEAAGKIRGGDIVMVTTNGAGFVWGAAIVRH